MYGKFNIPGRIQTADHHFKAFLVKNVKNVSAVYIFIGLFRESALKYGNDLHNFQPIVCDLC
jgi:hypothetical protein